MQPPGGHAIYLDARAFLPHVPLDEFPGAALAAELYLEGGIRSVEIGSLMFGAAAKMELVRLAIPRRVYTQSHIDYVIEVILAVWKRRAADSGHATDVRGALPAALHGPPGASGGSAGGGVNADYLAVILSEPAPILRGRVEGPLQ